MPFLPNYTSHIDKYYYKTWNILLKTKILDSDQYSFALRAILHFAFSSYTVVPTKLWDEVSKTCAILSREDSPPYKVPGLKEELLRFSRMSLRCIFSRSHFNYEFLKLFRMNDDFMKNVIDAMKYSPLNHTSINNLMIFIVESFPDVLMYNDMLSFVCLHVGRCWIDTLPERSLVFNYSLAPLSTALIKCIDKQIKNCQSKDTWKVFFSMLTKMITTFQSMKTEFDAGNREAQGELNTDEEEKKRMQEDDARQQAMINMVKEKKAKCDELFELIGLQNSDIMNLMIRNPESKLGEYMLRFIYDSSTLNTSHEKCSKFLREYIQRVNGINTAKVYNALSKTIKECVIFEGEEDQPEDGASANKKENSFKKLLEQLKPNIVEEEIFKTKLPKEIYSLLTYDTDINLLVGKTQRIEDVYSLLTEQIKEKDYEWVVARLNIFNALLQNASSCSKPSLCGAGFKLLKAMMKTIWSTYKNNAEFKEIALQMYSQFFFHYCKINNEYPSDCTCSISNPNDEIEFVEYVWDSLVDKSELMIQKSSIGNCYIRNGLIAYLVKGWDLLMTQFKSSNFCGKLTDFMSKLSRKSNMLCKMNAKLLMAKCSQ